MKSKSNKIKKLRETVELMKQILIGNTLEIFSITEHLSKDHIIDCVEFIYDNDMIVSLIMPIDDEYENYDLYYEIRVQTENDIITDIYYYFV